VLELPAEGDFDREETARAERIGFHLTGSRPPLYLIRSWHGEIDHERALARRLDLALRTAACGAESAAAPDSRRSAG
jgi:hypothetical protein